MQSTDYKHYSFLFFFLALGLLLFLPSFVARAMFLDGVTYATIARNMSEGIGSFWFPQYTCLRNEAFYIQPPLAFGLNALLFKVLGDADWVEKLYSLITLCISLFLLSKLWQFFTDSKQMLGLPLLLWLLTPIVAWTHRNNMLENTVNVFALASILSQLKSTEHNEIRKKMPALFLAALFLLGGFLSKGLVALFPLISLPLYLFLVKKEQKLPTFVQTFLFWAIFLTLLGLLLLLQPAANEALSQYFLAVKKMLDEKTQSSHFYMLNRLFQEGIVSLAALGIAVVLGRKKQIPLHFSKDSLFLFLTACSASLPMMISLRQSHYYVMPAMVYLTLATTLIIKPISEYYLQTIKQNYLHLLNVISCLFVGIAFMWAFQQQGKVAYAQDSFEDVAKIGKILPKKQVIKACHQLETDYELRAYLYRYQYLTLDTDLYSEVKPDTVLLPIAEGCSFIDMAAYQAMDLGLKKYKLMVRKPPTLPTSTPSTP